MSRSSNRDGASSSDSALSLIESKLFQRRRITSPASVRNSRYAICVPRPDDAANRQTIHTDIVERQPLFRFFTLHARVTAHFFRRHARSVRRQIEENDNDDAQGYPIIPTGRADHPETAHCPPQSLGRRYDRASRTRGGTFRAGSSQRPGAKRHRHLQISDRRRSRGDRAKTRAVATIRAASIDANPLDPLLVTTSKTRDTINSEDACLD